MKKFLVDLTEQGMKNREEFAKKHGAEFIQFEQGKTYNILKGDVLVTNGYESEIVHITKDEGCSLFLDEEYGYKETYIGELMHKGRKDSAIAVQFRKDNFQFITSVPVSVQKSIVGYYKNPQKIKEKLGLASGD